MSTHHNSVDCVVGICSYNEVFNVSLEIRVLGGRCLVLALVDLHL